MPNSAPAPASAYPAGGPWIRASAAQSPCRGALELRKPEASASSHSSTGIREKAPDSRSSCPSPRQDALPPLRDSQAAPPRSDKPCAHPASGIRPPAGALRSEEHTSELQSRGHLVCRLLLEKKKQNTSTAQHQPISN